MALRWPAAVARATYAALFVVALPVLLVAWARLLDRRLGLPEVGGAAGAGALVAAAGFLIWAAGVFSIVRRGGGLPLNAFPPPRLVTSGIYGIVAHPIYLGWVLACAGVALGVGSPGGLLVVTPAVALGCAALVIGHEGPDLRRRFGPRAAFRPWLSLPAEEAAPAALKERLAVSCLLVPTWLTLRAALCALLSADTASAGPAQRTAPGSLDFAAAVAVALAAFVTPTRAALRALAIEGLVALGLLTVVGLGLPARAWPAFPVVWTLLAASALAARSRSWATLGWVGAAGLAGAWLAEGRSAGAVAGAGLLALAASRPWRSWRRALDRTERLANSWRAFRLGPVRVISHGVYAGVAAALGLGGMGALAGPAALGSAAFVVSAALVGAALWAQLVEGSPRLLRPFGYYGSVVGAMLGAAVLIAVGLPGALVLASSAVVSPWVQAIGRLRCLVQGCCHGRPVDSRYGIRVVNEHSRVVALGGLAGQPIHPTQLYSIAGNVVIGVLLLRLWCVAAPIGFVGGAYLILAGLARFMEEAYRGEPQTIVKAGLPIYQYLAIASVVTGVGLTMLGGPRAPAPSSLADPALLAAAALMGVVYWFAMGVDFPESTRRFARLSG
jgi:protein-S-isoprenylcysteine O-methyltransferase Ste14